jgi:hypothetical protein
VGSAEELEAEVDGAGGVGEGAGADEVDSGFGDALTFSVTTPPAHGTLSGTTSNLSYTPNSGYHGPDGFSLKASDSQRDSSPTTIPITIQATNRPPVAVNDATTTNDGNPLDIAVLTNDSDPDGDTLQIASFTQPAHGDEILGIVLSIGQAARQICDGRKSPHSTSGFDTVIHIYRTCSF